MNESELRAILGLSPDLPLAVIPGAEFGNATEKRAERMSKLQNISVKIPVAFETVEVVRAERGEFTYLACVDPYCSGQELWDGCMQAVIRIEGSGYPGEVSVCCAYCEGVEDLADSVCDLLGRVADGEATMGDVVSMVSERGGSAAVLVRDRGLASVRPLTAESAVYRDDLVVLSVHGGDAAVEYARCHAATMTNETWIVGRALTKDVGEDVRPWALDDVVSGVIWGNVDDDGVSSPQSPAELTSII